MRKKDQFMQRHLTLITMVLVMAAIVIGGASQSAPARTPLPSTSVVLLQPTNLLATSIPPSVIPPGAATHIVRTGETLYAIALQYGVTVDGLVTANGLADDDTIFIGQTLVIPGVEVALLPIETPPPTPELLPTTLPIDIPVVATPLPTIALAAPSTLPTGAPTWTFDLGVLTPPVPIILNGITLDAIVVMPENVARNAQQIYVVGQELGRDPHSFSKLGDSTIENPHFLTRFDDGPYNLGDYAFLQPAIEYFHGSFARQGVAVQRGLHTWSVFDPMWADPYSCQPGEHMLACEFRIHNPSVVFIKLGSNDVGVPNSTDRNLRRIVEYCINNGVIPILNTKADRHEGAGNINNNIVRQIATDYQVPLLDFDVIAETLPSRGLAVDGVHLTSFFAHDWSSPIALQRGYGVHNLIALIILDRVWRVTQ
jgi:LysM repeat protein